ncbi:MAG TPA: LAGLIDADG family homing endonuclease [Pseudoneobacillus sp.]|jgi:intein-encoded DNA endonuclease-like protein|nr:LAGLIDADG family homing endonuclease [Pseudoneobacillus sp.]
MNKGNKKHQLNESYFENIDSEEKAYWLGFIMADGCVYKQESTYRFQMNLNSKDKDTLVKLNQVISSDYEVKDKLVNNHPVSMLKINSKEFCEHLINKGVIPKKSGKEVVPNIDRDLVRHFIRGYFDGDGSLVITKRKDSDKLRYKFCIVSSKKLLEQVIAILTEKECSIPPKAIQKTGEAYTLNIGSLDSIKKIRNYMYHDANIYLERKYDKFKTLS